MTSIGLIVDWIVKIINASMRGRKKRLTISGKSKKRLFCKVLTVLIVYFRRQKNNRGVIAIITLLNMMDRRECGNHHAGYFAEMIVYFRAFIF